ncbi:hypothetical protein QBC47DRAFT_455874 [Echria macrotheca]|uniref:DUF7730 domain-containing protein n=1 Tax=Echria macrotheca TaxID=438768 RepID=A0AAJ0BNG2_9PEZI|nr:hypothetical protein QBC47DRAFT_455874 [Echria macrotheca]
MSSIMPPDGTSAIDRQDESPFFSMPIELRNAVYEQLFEFRDQHVRSVAGIDGTQQFALTPCIAPPISDDQERVGRERFPKNDPKNPDLQPLKMRRIASSWGPHWMCEELALYPKECASGTSEGWIADAAVSRTVYPALLVCKRMYLDLVQLAGSKSDLHITDLQTLHALSITLSQPLTLFRELETASAQSKESDGSSVHDVEVRTWRSLPSRLLARFPSLRRFTIWLDHNDENNYWSVVNERAVLGPMECLKTIKPDLELVCFLPKSHPKIEDPQRHYLPTNEGCSSPCFEIRRTLRQRWRVHRSGSDPNDSLTFATDFPHILLEHYGSGSLGFAKMSLAEKEEYEMKLRRNGVDVDNWIEKNILNLRLFCWVHPNRQNPNFYSLQSCGRIV